MKAYGKMYKHVGNVRDIQDVAASVAYTNWPDAPHSVTLQLSSLDSPGLHHKTNMTPEEAIILSNKLREMAAQACMYRGDPKATGFKYKVGDKVKVAKCTDGVHRTNGKITNRRFTETDTQPCYLIEFSANQGSGPYHVEEEDIEQ